jgi:hypothetical protein
MSFRAAQYTPHQSTITLIPVSFSQAEASRRRRRRAVAALEREREVRVAKSQMVQRDRNVRVGACAWSRDRRRSNCDHRRKSLSGPFKIFLLIRP